MIIAEKGGSRRLFPHPVRLPFALYANVVLHCCVLCVRMTDLDREHSRGGRKEGEEQTGGLDPLPPRKLNGVGQSQGWLTSPGRGQHVPGEGGYANTSLPTRWGAGCAGNLLKCSHDGKFLLVSDPSAP